MLLFDITRMTTFVNLEKWVSLLRQKNPAKEKLPIILVAAKYDLKDFSMVGDILAKKVQKRLGFMDYVKTSSKTGKNVEEAFRVLVKHVLKREDTWG